MIAGNVRTWATCVWLTLAAAAAAAAAGATPFGGSSVVLPGTIEAENFDDGGQSIAYYDTTPGNSGGVYRQTDVDLEATADAGGGYDVAKTRAGEWLQYTVNVSATGTYALDLRVASLSTGGIVRVDVDGIDVTGPLTVPNTGDWQAWTTLHKDGLVLQAGPRSVRLVFVTAGTNGIANVNWLKFSLTTTLPAQWTSTDIGQPSPAGSASFANPVFTVKGAGTDIYGRADAFQFLSQPVSGDTQIIARLTSEQNTDALAKAGLMLRESTAADAAHVILDASPNGGVEFMARSVKGGATSYLGSTSVSFPAWLKLTRTGTTVAAAVSSDGLTWQPVGSTSVSATLGLAGMAVNSHNMTSLNTSRFDNVTVGPAPVVAPAQPMVGAPANGASNVAVKSALTWTASGATSYDVNVGTTNPPAAVATGLTAASYTPAALANATTYFWQVVAKNAGGSTAGPVWSFTTVAAAPAQPTVGAPANGASSVAVNSALTWSASGATSYDVKVGTTNPPATVASGLTAASYAPAALANSTTYFWQVVAKNAGGSTAGPVWSFTTVASAPKTTESPIAYTAITDRNPRPKPALPQVGAAGFQFADPTFGSQMLRVTDGTTRPGALNRSYRVSSNAHLSVWNANSTMFYIISNDGTIIPYQFDAATMKASRLQASGSGDGGMTLRFYIEPHFSVIDPNVIYGAGGSNSRSIMQYDFRTGAYTTLLDLDTVVGGLDNTYVSTVITGGTTSENLMTFFGGPGQDSHYYLLWAPVNNLGARKIINTVDSTINGVPTNVPLNFHIHAASIDRSGRYVFIYPTSVDLAAPRQAAQVFLWDTATDLITPLPAANLSGGHDAAGFGYWVNQDCCTATSWDAGQWQFRYLDTPTHTTDLVPQVLTPQEIYLADHTSWSNARPDALVPVISSTYRYAGLTAPLRAWDDEIIGLDVNNGAGGGPVYRFAHHRSDIRDDNNPASAYFWYEPIANVSPDGRFVIFTTNWEKTLGKDSSEGTFRQDVFMVQLTPQ